MAEEFQLGSGNLWDSSRSRFDSSGSSNPASASTGLSSMGSFIWPTEMVEIKPRSAMDSVSISGSSMIFPADSQKLHSHEPPGTTGGVLQDPNLQMMGLGLDWNQSLFRNEKADQSSFRSMLQEDMGSSTNYRQEAGLAPSMHEFKQINRGFSLDQPQYSSQMSSNMDSETTSQGSTTNFLMDSGAYGSPSTMLQGLLLSSDNQPHAQQMNYPYASNYGGLNTGDQQIISSSSSWSNKFPQFLKSSPPKQPSHNPNHQLHFSNNTPFWNASAAAMNDARSSFFPSLPAQIATQPIDEKPKNAPEIREIGSMGKKSSSSSESSNKRPRNETPSPMPAFKVRKEKMGERITALQQLVSPFGKTDTASVLSEAIEYIKFLHEQVSALSSPYMKSGHIQHQQNSDKSKDPEGPRQDLRSRGLCLVPVASTFPVTHEATVDFWTPTFGGTFR